MVSVRNLLSFVAIALVVAVVAWPFSGWPRGSDTQEARAVAVVSVSALPVEARHTIKLIRQGGPFPYERDGAVFRNFERLLPQRDRGYYREYTVRTPGISHRGARRIVAGRGGELYYTDDHYASFRRVHE
jgi:ribonuclease T1